MNPLLASFVDEACKPMPAEAIFKEAVRKELRALRKLKGVWKKIPPAGKAGVGAAAGGLGYMGATGRLQEHFFGKMTEGVELATADEPIPIAKDSRGTEILKWIKRFKKDHPEVKDVPVYVSGRVETSQYITDAAFKLPGSAEGLKEEYKITKPGIYLREMSAPIALHELGHVALDRKVPGISLLTHGASLAALPLLASVIFRKPVKKAGFIERFAPAISAALQLPLLAEEAGASIIAEKTLRERGETGKKRLLPAWLTYAVAAGTLPTATAAATFLKRL